MEYTKGSRSWTLHVQNITACIGQALHGGVWAWSIKYEGRNVAEKSDCMHTDKENPIGVHGLGRSWMYITIRPPATSIELCAFPPSLGASFVTLSVKS